MANDVQMEDGVVHKAYVFHTLFTHYAAVMHNQFPLFDDPPTAKAANKFAHREGDPCDAIDITHDPSSGEHGRIEVGCAKVEHRDGNAKRL